MKQLMIGVVLGASVVSAFGYAEPRVKIIDGGTIHLGSIADTDGQAYVMAKCFYREAIVTGKH